MEKIICNLISNALKFTSENGEIKLTVNIISSFVEIIIKDSGIGIPADRLPNIFNRFYQIDSSITREFEGTGIGLALTKELVELHKGKISVNSIEGKGSEFIIHLPLGDLKTLNSKSIEISDDNFTFDDNLIVSESPEAELLSGNQLLRI